jgi:hypothetical protein
LEEIAVFIISRWRITTVEDSTTQTDHAGHWLQTRATHSLLAERIITKNEKVRKSYAEISGYCLTKY